MCTVAPSWSGKCFWRSRQGGTAGGIGKMVNRICAVVALCAGVGFVDRPVRAEELTVLWADWHPGVP